jgi:hypothetical protein
MSSITSPRPRTALRACAALLALAGLANVSLAQYSEDETPGGASGNSTRATANPIPPSPSGAGLQPGQTISGTTTGTGSTNAVTSADFFDIRVDTAPLAIYKNRVTITSTNTGSYSGGLRGYTQTNGVISTTDAQVTLIPSASSPKYAQWYGFGRGEHAILQLTGLSTTPNPYTITYTRETVTPTVVSGVTFSQGAITVKTTDQAYSTNTEFFVYDANLNPVVPTPDTAFNNDDNTVAGGGTGSGSKSIATRNLTPGDYYVAISTFNLANNIAAPTDERTRSSPVWSGPDAISTSATAVGDVSFTISDAAGNSATVPATKADLLDIVWVKFTVGAQTNTIVSGQVTPSAVSPGSTSITVTLTAQPVPGSSVVSATVNLTALGGPAAAPLTAGPNNTWTTTFAVPYGAPPGSAAISYTVSDNAARVATGTLGVTVNPVVPINDDCSGAIVLTDAQLPYAATVGINLATADPLSPCSTGTSSNNGIWYAYTPSQNCVLSAWELGSRNVDVVVYTGGCGNLTPVFCENTEDDANVPLQAGVPYLILFTTPGSASTGANDVFNVAFRCGVPTTPANADCGTATALTPTTPGNPVFQSFPAGGAGPGPRSQCQTLSTQPPESRNAVWFTYTTGPSDELIRAWRANNAIFFSLAFYTGTCGNLQPYECLNLGTVSTGTSNLVRLHANTTYTIQAHKRSGYLAADGSYDFVFQREAVATTPNPDCNSARQIDALPYTDTVPNILAFDETAAPTNGCGGNSAAFGSGVWYSFTPTQPTNLTVAETGSQDAAIRVYEGTCSGTIVMCSALDDETGVAGANTFRAYPGFTYYILVGLQNSGLPDPAGTLTISVTGAQVPVPANDDCSTATVVTSLPFSDTVAVGTAADDTPRAVCSRGTITQTTRNGIWYRYTNGPSPAALVMAETGPLDSIIAAYKGDCSFRVPVMCTDAPESNIYLYMEPSTTYSILVAKASDLPASAGDALSVTFSLANPVIPPPSNQACESAQILSSMPFTYTGLPLAARHYPATTCLPSSSANQSTNTLWYAIDSGTGFTLRLSETTSANDVAYALVTDCSQPFQEFCSTTDGTAAAPVTYILNPFTRYYLQVSRQSNSDYTLGATPYNLTITAAPGTDGACCNGTACTATVIESCASTFVPGATCDPVNPTACCPANYNGTNGVDLLDIFAFLNDWFTQRPKADFNHQNGVELLDIFAFLNAWFAGC